MSKRDILNAWIVAWRELCLVLENHSKYKILIFLGKCFWLIRTFVNLYFLSYFWIQGFMYSMNILWVSKYRFLDSICFYQNGFSNSYFCWNPLHELYWKVFEITNWIESLSAKFHGTKVLHWISEIYGWFHFMTHE